MVYEVPDPAPEAPSVPAIASHSQQSRRDETYRRYGDSSIAQLAAHQVVERSASRKTSRLAQADKSLSPAAEPQVDEPLSPPAGSIGDSPESFTMSADESYLEEEGEDVFFEPSPHHGRRRGQAARRCRHGADHCCLECLFNRDFWANLSLFGGVQGFKGAVDDGANGNFGFHEGFNWSHPLFEEHSIGVQAGGEVVHSDLSGGGIDGDDRRQYFVTGGVFYAPQCDHVLQGGAVFDYLHDDFGAAMDLTQVRAELSYRGGCGRDFGVWIAAHGSDDASLINSRQTRSYQATDMYAFFYRWESCRGGMGRVWGGFTGGGEGILGAESRIPLSERWSLESGVNYRLPDEANSTANSREESWGLAISLVWRPFSGRDCGAARFRPLFNVADNNSFFVDRVR